MTTVEGAGPIWDAEIVRFVRRCHREMGPTRDGEGDSRWLARPVDFARPPPRCPEAAEVRALALAAVRARTVHPGPVGELIQREIRAYLDFGHRFGHDAALIGRLAAEVLAEQRAG